MTGMLVHASCYGAHLLSGVAPVGAYAMRIGSTTATTACPTRTVMIVTAFFAFLLVYFFDGSQLFFELHSTVLKPNLDLTFSQAESMSNFNASATG